MNTQLLHEISKHLTTEDGQSYAVPVGGSLGLLALGDVGLMAWRQAKLAYLQAQQNTLTNPPSNQATTHGQ